MKRPENIILDLGGVVLHIDYQKTIDEFKSYGIDDFDKKYNQAMQSEVFNKFEKGQIARPEFYAALRSWGFSMEDRAIDECWNKMIQEVPRENLRYLQDLAAQYNLVLLSNTNEIHIEAFRETIDQKFGWNKFKKLFSRIYFSNLIGMRKPDAEIFQFVIDHSNLNIRETIFIDDSIQHVQGAKELGIAGFLYVQNTALHLGLSHILAKFNQDT